MLVIPVVWEVGLSKKDVATIPTIIMTTMA
jgi:hypothetical protein